MRASFKLNSNTVEYTSECPMTGEVHTREFSVPHSGGYVRDGRGKQVCERLSSRGNTLTANDGNDLLVTIRREHKKYMAWAKKENYPSLA